jgi:N,N-dimethylformamidase beta subunit-like, C-terminal
VTLQQSRIHEVEVSSACPVSADTFLFEERGLMSESPVNLDFANTGFFTPANFWSIGTVSWEKPWSHIVAGKFSSSPYDGLFCYSATLSVGAFYSTDGAGHVQLLSEKFQERQFTHVATGIFDDSGFAGILLYDQTAGVADFYSTDGKGSLTLLQSHNDWRKTWTHIVAAPFVDSPHTAILLYDQTHGYGAIFATDGRGGILLVEEHTNWRTMWTQIVAGEFDWENESDRPKDLDHHPSPIFADLFFFEDSTGYAETYSTDGHGNLNMLGTPANFPTGCNILPGTFGCLGRDDGGWLGWTNLMFYNRVTNKGTIFALDGSNRWIATENFDLSGIQSVPFPNAPLDLTRRPPRIGLPPRRWDFLVPGNFWMAEPDDHFFGTKAKYPQYRLIFNGGFTDVLFYSMARKTGDFRLHEPAQTMPKQPLVGYAAPRSVFPGEVVSFFVSTLVGPYSIAIYRQDADLVHMADVPVAPNVQKAYPISRTAYKDGANWPPVASLVPVPAYWPSGLYIARVTAQNQPVTVDIPFVVRAAQVRARILVSVADTTYEAYNAWGGRCLYGHGATGTDQNGQAVAGFLFVSPYNYEFLLPRAFRVSFNRGFWSVTGFNRWQSFEVPLLRWLARHGLHADVCAVSDLHKGPQILKNYRLFVSVGHDEYWSREMRDNVEGFVRAGGNAAFFSGNVCWWQVRFENGGDTMVCYKDKEFDSEKDASLVSTYWKDVGRPSNTLTGVYGDNPWNNVPPNPPAPGQYFVVQDDNYWVFNGTGLGKNDHFGSYWADGGHIGSVVGGETDVPTSDTPASFEFQKMAIAYQFDAETNKFAETATMGVSRNGGIIFTAATINWALGLSQTEHWTEIDKITWNVFNLLG